MAKKRAFSNLIAEAKARGDKFYYTGVPCPKGHIAGRYVSCYRCVGCAEDQMASLREATKKRRELRPLTPRQQAKKDGLSRYNTGQACSRGHYSDRLVINGACMDCSAENQARYLQDGEISDRRKIYRINNAERYRSHTRNRRAKQKSLDGSHSEKDVDFLWDQQRGRCAYCKCRLSDGYHVDHKVPTSKGGGNSRANLQLTCQKCNLKKHNKDPIEFAQKNGMLL